VATSAAFAQSVNKTLVFLGCCWSLTINSLYLAAMLVYILRTLVSDQREHWEVPGLSTWRKKDDT
jgi:hypothetical protein